MKRQVLTELITLAYFTINARAIDPTLPESPALAEVYKAAREQWAVEQGTSLTEIRAKLGTTMTQGYSSQDRLASLDAHFQMLSEAGFKTVAVPWKYHGLAVFGGCL